MASRMLRDTLRQFVKRGATVFLTSHVLEIVEKLCTDVGIIAQGRLTFQASMTDIHQTGTLEERFLATITDGHADAQKLSWLKE